MLFRRLRSGQAPKPRAPPEGAPLLHRQQRHLWVTQTCQERLLRILVHLALSFLHSQVHRRSFPSYGSASPHFGCCEENAFKRSCALAGTGTRPSQANCRQGEAVFNPQPAQELARTAYRCCGPICFVYLHPIQLVASRSLARSLRCGLLWAPAQNPYTMLNGKQYIPGLST